MSQFSAAFGQTTNLLTLRVVPSSPNPLPPLINPSFNGPISTADGGTTLPR